METPKSPRRGGGSGGGAPSGSITHPRAKLSKDADGTWRVRNDETGDSWRWDADSEVWRGEGNAEDMRGEPGPQDTAYWLSGAPNRPD